MLQVLLEQFKEASEDERGDLLKSLVTTLAEMPYEERAGVIRKWILSLPALDVALLYSILGGLIHRDDLEADYIVNRVKEWLDLKLEKES